MKTKIDKALNRSVTEVTKLRQPRAPPRSAPYLDEPVALGVAVVVCYERGALDLAKVAEDSAKVLRARASTVITRNEHTHESTDMRGV